MGTYDGEEQRLYVNGSLVGAALEESGPVEYPAHARYHAGAYRDDDEYFRMRGMLNELSLYRRALGPDEIGRRYREKRDAFPPPAPPEPEVEPAELAWGPVLRFTGGGTASLAWETFEREPSAVSYGLPGEEPRTAERGGRRRRHELQLTELEPRALYTYRIRVGAGEDAPWTRAYECDTHFDYTAVRPAPPDDPSGAAGEAAALAQAALAACGPGPGLCAVAGLEGEALAEELAARGELRVALLAADPAAARAARARLLGSGLYGDRLVVVDVAPAGPLALPPAFANLLVVPPGGGGEARALLERGALDLVRPFGGLALVPEELREHAGGRPELSPADAVGPWRVYRRGPLEGAGEWTHMYGRPDNSAFGGEELGGATGTGDLALQWIGRPGPRHQSDRQNRKPSPLAAGGRLFVQGLGRVLALDALNGTLLWSLELPELRRFNVPRSSSNWCADAERVFVALGDRVLALDAATGAEVRRYEVLPGDRSRPGSEWGYVARAGDLLLGSAVQPGSQFEEFWGSQSWYDAKAGADAAKVCSDSLFALDAADGRRRWAWESGLVFNATITVEGGRVVFVETRDPAALAAREGRLGDGFSWEELHLVALELETGRLLWERPARPMPGHVAFYLAASAGRLVLLSSSGGAFALYAFDAASGESLWRRKFGWEVDHHGKHLSRPAVVGGRVYVRPLVFDLESGDELPLPFPAGHQCGTYTASRHALFLRAGELAVWDPSTGSASRWSRVRPDCWISTVPASGLLLSPEGGGGCSCGSWLEASMGFLPAAHSGG